MSLKKYQQKRRFDETPEPPAKEQRGGDALRFVVQKHDARRLHYDLRLELDGVLKSWAVPKGPSLNPEDKRLAVMVEDHPLDYRTFEGVIPQGNYGAGPVMVWDEGTYCSRQSADRAESERLMREGLAKGHLTFILNGQKLQGEFALVKIKRDKKNNWLLLKKRDPWASEADVTKDDRSVSTGRDLDEIAAKKKLQTSLPRGNDKMPHKIKPMLANLAEAPFDRKGWFFEVKWNGFRGIAEVEGQSVKLYSRNHISFADRFGPIVESLQNLGHDAVLDGEVVVVDSKGRPQFELLQNYQNSGRGNLLYYVFDLLYLDGHDLRNEPLRKRKEQLAQILDGMPNILLSEHIEEHGKAFFNAAAEQELEGVMAKDAKSPYVEGKRSAAWLKIKVHRSQEAVICGYTEPQGSRKDIGAVVLGVYRDDKLVYIGNSAGKLTVKGLADLHAMLQPLECKQCPFAVKPKMDKPVHWVEPKLVCEVRFQEWTSDGIMRIPIFIGLRDDKPAQAVRREIPMAVNPSSSAPSPVAAANSSASPPTPTLTNLNKVYWPDEGCTKGELIEYYRDVAPVILPYLRGRPESLNRHPNGIKGKNFFQKDVSRQPPPQWVETTTIGSDAEKRTISYLLCQNEATLLYMANLGCIELNPWHSRIGSLDRPDYLVIDLDPEAIDFSQVVEAAVTVRTILERAGAECVCKTSGKRGLHIYVPLGARYDGDHALQFAQLIATLAHRQLPATTSLIRSPKLRQGKVYLDYLQNRRGQTLAAPYSVRPYKGATVSAPLQWKEVKKGLDPAAFTIKTMRKRLDRIGDVWQPVLGKGIDLADCLHRLTAAGGAK